MALSINQTQLDSYNKSTSNGKGTLIQNWHEESILRAETGQGRLQNNCHIKKKHHDLFNNSPQKNEQGEKSLLPPNASTTQRIFGLNATNFQPSSSKTYGKTQNPVDAIPKIGKRHQMIEQQYLKQIQDEIDHQNKIEEQEKLNRVFETTTKTEYGQKNIIENQNTIGKWVMKSQDGKQIPGLEPATLRQPQQTDNEKTKSNEQESYLTSAPLTFYTDKVNQGTIYLSKPINNARPFHKVDEFVKNYHHFTHIKN